MVPTFTWKNNSLLPTATWKTPLKSPFTNCCMYELLPSPVGQEVERNHRRI